MTPINPTIKKPRLTRIYLRSMLLTMLGSIALFALADLSISFLIIGSVGALIGYWYAAQGPSSISRMAINALLAIVVVLGLVNALRGDFSVSSFAFFSLLLLILKLFDLRTPRDHAQILVLSLGLIIAAALTSNSMPTGVFLFIMGFVFIRALMLFRLFALAPNYTPTPSTDTHFLKPASIDLRSIQTATGFVCTIGALIIFLIMPRSLGNNTLGQWGGAGVQTLTAGFAEDVELGRPGRITSSPTPVLRMTIRDRNDQPIGTPNSRAIYLRGSVLTQYQSGRWIAHHDQNIPTTFRTRILERNQSLPLVNDNSRAQWTQEYQFVFDRPDQNYGYLFTPWKPLELKATTTQARVGVDPDTRMILLASQPVATYRVRTIDPEFEPLAFPTDTEDQPAARQPVNQQGIPPQIAALAAQILTRTGIDPNPQTRPPQQDIQAVRALETHLRTQFSYTLVSEPVPPNRDATEWFLFDRKQGHCEYYASALTLMTRSIGVPARVITGYVAAEYNDVTDAFVVRESNAHAWVEAMVAPDLWRTFDGTPQSDFHDIHEPEPTFFRSISKFYEAIEQAWVTAIIGYDSDSRDAVLGDLDPDLNLDSVTENLQNRIAAGRVQLLRKALITAGTIFVISMSLGLTLIFFTRRANLTALISRIKLLLTFNPDRRSRTKEEHTAAHLTHLIHTHLHSLERPCPQGTPLRTHLATLPDPAEPTATTLHAILNQATALLYTHRYSKHAHNPEFIPAAQPLIKCLRDLR